MSTSEGKVVIAQGRIVWTAGDLFKGKVQNIFGTNQPKLNQAGEQVVQFGFGLAIPKTELALPDRGQLWKTMHDEAYTLYPTGQIPPSFAMKYKDGDGIDDQGKPFASREGYPGCLVFALTTTLPIRFFRWEGGQNVQVSDGIKCGDYVNVQVMVKAHAAIGAGKAGLYLNPMAVQLVAAGKEIVNAPTGDMVFGTVAPAAPAGYVPPAQPAAMPPVNINTPPAAPAPHYGVLPQPHQPPPGGQPMPAPSGMPPIPR